MAAMEPSQSTQPTRDPYLESFLSHLGGGRGYSQYTIRNYVTALEEFLQWYRNQFNTTPNWTAISQETFRLYLRHLGKNNLKPASIRVKFAALRSFYRFLIRNGFTSLNPVKTITLPKHRRGLPMFLTKEQMLRLLNAPFEELRNLQPNNPTYKQKAILCFRDAAILETLYSCGLRISELCTLRATDIDWNNQLVRVQGKGKKERFVPIGAPALEAIRKYWSLLPALPTGEQPVFLAKTGSPVSPRDFQRRLKKYLLQAGLDPAITPHKIRHSYATHLLDAGADLRSVQELLGHARVATTQIYTHITTHHLKKIYEKTHPRA